MVFCILCYAANIYFWISSNRLWLLQKLWIKHALIELKVKKSVTILHWFLYVLFAPPRSLFLSLHAKALILVWWLWVYALKLFCSCCKSITFTMSANFLNSCPCILRFIFDTYYVSYSFFDVSILRSLNRPKLYQY